MMKRRIKAELEDSSQDFQRQLHSLDAKLKALRDREREITEENSQTHVHEEKLNAALAEVKEK